MNNPRSIEQAVTEIQRRLGGAIRAERLRLNLMQADVALTAGISRATVIAAEAGQGVSSQNLFALAAAVGLTCVLQAARQPQARPRLKALMQSEPERASARRAPAGEVSVAASVITRSTSMDSTSVLPVGDSGARRRPRLKTLMKEERIWMANLRAKVTAHE